jgi:hypothetical protein
VRDASKGKSTKENLPCAETQENGGNKAAVERPLHAVSQGKIREERQFCHSHNHQHQGVSDRRIEDDQDPTCKVMRRNEWRYLIKRGANADNLIPLRWCAIGASPDNAAR